MGIVAASAHERQHFDAHVEILRRVMIGKAPFAGLAGAVGVSEPELKAGLLKFLGSCRVAVLTEADLSAGTFLKPPPT